MPEDTIIGKKTPHMFVWLCDGKKIGDYDLPLPQGSPNYNKTLVEECKNLKQLIYYFVSIIHRQIVKR